MIPVRMKEFLKNHIPDTALKNRTDRHDGKCYLELGHTDEHLLSRIGINCDRLGPRLVVGMWDEASPVEVGGYLVVDNLAMGSPAMGGIRMLPDITPADIHNLARGMTLKNAAADLPYGGGKAGIVAEPATSSSVRFHRTGSFGRSSGLASPNTSQIRIDITITGSPMTQMIILRKPCSSRRLRKKSRLFLPAGLN